MFQVIKKITNDVNLGILTLDDYKKNVGKQKDYENIILERLKKDDKAKWKDKIVERINNRIKILETELNSNIEEPEPEPQVVKDEKKVPTDSEIDFYDDKLENKLHNTAKFFSMGVLEEEMKLMDTIINLKKKKKDDPTTWELKKDAIKLRITVITLLISENHK